jgi:hypothetical protein
VKSETSLPEEKVKFPTPPEPEKVKSDSPNILETLQNTAHKVVDTKERKDKGEAPVSLSGHKDEDTPGHSIISPEVARKFGLRYNVADWPPPRRED